MNALINRFYQPGTELHTILTVHSRAVADKALQSARKHPELNIDIQFVEQAAMLHDIGIFLCDAPGIHCFGHEPYIRHGILGAELLRNEGLPRHALVCERHTGAGLSLQQITTQGLPLPHQDYLPVSLEEQLICWADKFFSKTKLEIEKTEEQARRSLERFGQDGVERFDAWCNLFG